MVWHDQHHNSEKTKPSGCQGLRGGTTRCAEQEAGIPTTFLSQQQAHVTKSNQAKGCYSEHATSGTGCVRTNTSPIGSRPPKTIGTGSYLAVPPLILPTTAKATEHASLSSAPTATPSTSFRPPASNRCQVSCKHHNASRAPQPVASPAAGPSLGEDFFLPLFLLGDWAAMAPVSQKSGLAAMSATRLKNLERHSSSIFGGSTVAAVRIERGMSGAVRWCRAGFRKGAWGGSKESEGELANKSGQNSNRRRRKRRPQGVLLAGLCGVTIDRLRGWASHSTAKDTSGALSAIPAPTPEPVSD